MRKDNQPDPAILKKKLDIKLPLIGFYDAPDPTIFKPLVTPNKNDCIFSFYKNIGLLSCFAGLGLGYAIPTTGSP